MKFHGMPLPPPPPVKKKPLKPLPESTPAPLDAFDTHAWVTAYASAFPRHGHEGALVMADGCVTSLQAHRAGEGRGSRYRGDAP